MCSLADFSKLSGKSSPFLFQIRRWRNLKMEELKNLIPGCKHKNLVSTYYALVPIVSTSYGLTYSLPHSSVKQMAVLLVLQMMKLSTEKLRRLAKVTQLGSGRAGILTQASSLQGFALYNSLWSHLLCQTTDHTAFWGVAPFESVREKIWGQLWVSLTPFEQGSWHPWEVPGAWALLGTRI